ncbi:MAG: hypothetical protein IPJ77_09125 [Planctomycetes bacterium]|nr:hypothetical protein [Planctomycetota bacterium]
MKTTLTLLTLLCSAASASAQVKLQSTSQLPMPPKQAMTAPVYIPPPPGTQLLVVGGSDDCSTAATNDAISGVGTFSVTNVGATNGAPDSTGCINTQLDVWFYWTATQTGAARLQLCGQTTTDTVVAIWADNNGGACPSGTAVACNDDSCGLQSQVIWPTTAGQTYFFQIGAFGAATTYTANFVVDYLPPPPANDDCSAAITVVGLGSFPVDTSSATTGGPTAACTTVNADVWYYWVAPQTGIASVDTCGGTTANTRIAAWLDNNGGACPTGTSVACNDDACGTQSQMTWAVNAGDAFFLQLGGLAATTWYTGTFNIGYLPPPPANDDCAAPVVITGAGPHAYDIGQATTGVQGQAEAICLFFATTAIRKDLWYTWTPSVGGTATMTLCGGYTGANSTTDSKIAIYDGAGCPATAAIACVDDDNTCTATPLTTTVTWNTVCGQTYTIQLGTFSNVATATMSGTFTITETGTACTTPIVSFCAGDGTLVDHTTSCPCGNNGTGGNGCANSANANGANLTTTGSTVSDNVVLQGSGMPLTVSCIYLQGTATDDIVFGDGVRCTGGTLLRLRTKANVAGASSFPDSVETITLSQRGGVTPGSGLVRYYQTYYRNTAALFCPPETFNVTNGRVITW